MPKRTMGGRGDAGADALVDEASKPRMKLDMEKPIAAGEGSSGQLAGLTSSTPSRLFTLSRWLLCRSRSLLCRASCLLCPSPWSIVTTTEKRTGGSSGFSAGAGGSSSVAGCSTVAGVASSARARGRRQRERRRPSQPEQVAPLPQLVAPLPRVLPPLPEPVVVINENEEDILSEDVDNDEEGQMIYRKHKRRELDNGVHYKRVRPRFGRSGYGCPFCNKLMKGNRQSVIQHAIGASLGSLKNDHAFRVAHAAYAEYLLRL